MLCSVYCHDTYPAKAGGFGAGLQIKAGSFRNIVRNRSFPTAIFARR